MQRTCAVLIIKRQQKAINITEITLQGTIWPISDSICTHLMCLSFRGRKVNTNMEFHFPPIELMLERFAAATYWRLLKCFTVFLWFPSTVFSALMHSTTLYTLFHIQPRLLPSHLYSTDTCNSLLPPSWFHYLTPPHYSQPAIHFPPLNSF